MTTNYAKLIELKRSDRGELQNVTESVIGHDGSVDLSQMEYKPFKQLQEGKLDSGRSIRMPLKEAILQPDAANMLRNDIRFIAFANYAEAPRSFDTFTDFMDSNMPQEEYLRDAAMGSLPRVRSGDPVPMADTSFEGGVIIKNYRYAVRYGILGDWIRFDQIGKIAQTAENMGRAARMTEEQAVYNYITTTGNYGRNSTTNDNDIGANTQTLTFNADSLDTALTIIATSKDRKSGAYLGFAADTIVIGPRMETFVKQFLMSGDLVRAGSDTTTAETRGMGEMNPYRGLLSKIVVSPWFGASWGWALTDSRRNSFKFQTVEPFQVGQTSQTVDSDAWRVYDNVEYMCSDYFGVGMVDDRAWFYSNSSTEPTVT